MGRVSRRVKALICICFVVTTCFSCIHGINAQNVIKDKLGKAIVGGGFQMKDYWVWGSSVIKGEDGKYHMFASRWPKYIPFHPGWMVASEIVRAVSDKPEGPYKFEEVVLPARGAQFWDGKSTHNPKIVKYKDTYILYYMGSTHPFEELTPENIGSFDLKSKHCIVGRWKKRIGIAVSKSIHGPWKRYDKPILDVKPNSYYSFLTSNPSPLIKENGEVVLIFKGRSYKGNKHGPMNIGVAVADSFEGPYRVVGDKPFFSKDRFGVVEDPHMWVDKKGFHMLAKDHKGSITGEAGAGFLAHSSDGMKWNLDSSPKAYSKKIGWNDGVTRKMGQLERPFVFVENGQPTHIFFATMDGPGGFENATKSWNMVIPLKNNK
ncbi:MAG: glycoside hydrolase family protein [Prolixibacteraceae bacterium]|jgi:hypothetical protein|nr:glycoside hydrolase family protein [Prolixibacteraceae bacterium]